MSKFKPNMAGQSVVDRVLAAKHTVAGQSLAKVICKATTEELMGPKRKHLDYLLQCTNEPNVSVPEMANILIERAQNSNWVVVFKALITVHNLMNYGNERFTQYLASNNCTFNLTTFTDRSGTQGYDMSTYIRRYAKYLNEKAFSYRQMAFDFCKVKRGKEDGMLRTMNTDKLLKTLPVLQSHLDALLEYDVTANELTNGVINAAFMLLFKDLIRLFACYNDGIINLLEKYFEMNKKNCREALDVYKKFLARMDRVCSFLKVAENVGIDKGDIPDLAKAPASLLEALEQHLNSLESCKKSGSTVPPKPSSGVSTVISNYAAAAQMGAAPGAGSGITQITEEERRRILEEEQRQLDQMKRSASAPEYAVLEQQRLKQMASSSPPVTSNSNETAAKSLASTLTSPTRPSDQLAASVSGSLHSSPISDDPFSIAASQPTFGATASAHTAFNSNSTSLEPLFGASTAAQTTFGSSATGDAVFGSNTFAPSFGANPALFAPAAVSNPFVAPAQPVMVLPQAAWASPVGTQAAATSLSPAAQGTTTNSVDVKFAAAFSNAPAAQKPGYDGFGEVMRPSPSLPPGSTPVGLMNQSGTHPDKLIQSDLDGSLALLAGNLSIRPDGQMKRTDHQWTGAPTEKRLTGAGASWGQSPTMSATNYPVQVPGVPSAGVPVGVPPTMMAAYPVAVAQPTHPTMVAQLGSMGWPQTQPQMFGMTQPNAPQTMRPVNTPNDPFGSL